MGNPFFSEQGYQTYPFEKENFHRISHIKSDRKICSIDGGNQELYPAPEYSIQLNRLYFNIFKNKRPFPLKSDIPRKIEFLSLTSLKREQGNTHFKTNLSIEQDRFRKYLPSDEDLQIKTSEADFRMGNKTLMERMASMARRLSEWTIAEHIIDSELKEGDIIIKDGSLQTSHPNEVKYVEKIFDKAREKGVIFTGLSKSCRLTTNTGFSLIASMEKFAADNDIQYDQWCYYPIARSKEGNDHKATIMIVKLNKHATTPFRFEIIKDQIDQMTEEEIIEMVSFIADYSRDIVIPGYPYGLFDAHLWARVRNEDLSNYKIMLESELGGTKSWESFNTRIKAVSMHDRLDGL